MKKLLLVVALVAGGLVVKAQDENVTNEKKRNQHVEQNTGSMENGAMQETSRSSNQSTQQDAKNVPSNAKETLRSKYPEATNVKWSKKDKNHEAKFIVKESEYMVLFDNSGRWVSTKIENTPVSEIPQKVRDGINRSEFKTWSIKEVDTEEMPNKTTYKVEVKSGMKEQELTVDQNGTIIRKGNKSSM